MFFNRIPIESLKICYSNAMQLGQKFLAAIFSAILYFDSKSNVNDLLVHKKSFCQFSVECDLKFLRHRVRKKMTQKSFQMKLR